MGAQRAAMWKPGDARPAASPRQQTAAHDSKDKISMETSSSAHADDTRPKTKAALSQKTLAMKFMQRKKDAQEQKQNAMKQRKQDETWEVPTTTTQDRLVCVRDVRDPSFASIFGRRSFGGFNKAVEEEYQEVRQQLRFAASEEREAREEISAEEMTSRMLKYTGLRRGNPRNDNSARRPAKRPCKR